MYKTNEVNIEKLQVDLANLQKENTRLRKTAADATSELNTLKKENTKRNKTISILSIVLCGLLFVLILSNCKVASAIIAGFLLAGFSFNTYKLFKL